MSTAKPIDLDPERLQVVLIPSDDRRFAPVVFVVTDPDMAAHQAAAALDDVVDAVKRAKPDDYVWHDLETATDSAGLPLVCVNAHTTGEDW